MHPQLGGDLLLAGVPAVHAGHCAGAALHGHDGCLLYHISGGAQGGQKEKIYDTKSCVG